MFSGIIAAVGRISQLASRNDGTPTVRLTVDAGPLDLGDVVIGDSIACNGVCLTVVEKTSGGFCVDVSPETLSCTVGLSEPGPVNLEKALRLADRLGGHLVSGHVDGVGEVVRFEPVGALASGKDGLDDLRTIAAEAPSRLEPGGWLLVEHGWHQGGAVRTLLAQAGFVDCVTEQDIEGRERVTCGRCVAGEAG